MMRQRLVQVLRSADDGPNLDTVVRRFWSSAEAPRPPGPNEANAANANVLDLVPRLQARAAQTSRR
jgi:hypothetical protein